MSTNNVTPNPDAPQPQAGTLPAVAPPGVGNAITGQPQGQPTTGQPPVQPTAAPQAQPNQPNAAQPNAAQPNADPMDAHVSVYRKFLQGFKSPVGSYVDPSGNVKPTNISLGRTVLASVLAGMMSPTQYRDTPYGPVVSGSATAAGAFAAGQGVIAKQQQEAQALSDKEQSVRLMNVKNNIDQVHLMAALAQQKHQDLQGAVDSNSLFLKDLEAYDAQQPDSKNKLILATGLTFKQAMDSPQFGQGKMTRNNLVMSGSQDIYDPQTGQTTIEPTFTLINPDAHVALSPEAIKTIETINPSFTGLSEVTGGNVRLPVHQYLAAMNQVSTVQAAESFFKRADEALGISDNFDLSAAVKKNRNLMPAIMAAENAISSGGSTADALARIQQTAGSSAIFDAMGVSQDDVTKYINKVKNEEARQTALAKEGGIGDKAPAPPQMIADLTAAAKKLHPDQAQAIMAGINPAGLTVGEAEKIKNNILQAQNSNVTNAQPTAAGPTPTGFVFNPDAPTMDSPTLRTNLQKQGVKLPANFEALYGIAHNANPLTTLPPNPRKGSNQMSAQEGLAFIRQYINPNYQEGDYAAAASLSKELASTRQGTAGGTLYNAGTASQHLELLDEAAKALNNNDTQALNHLANTFGVAIGKSPAVTFKAIAEQVNGEVGKVVAGGTPHEAELAELRSNLNSDQSPEQTKNVIRAYVKLMAGRISEINDRSQQYFNRDVKGVSPTTVKVFNKYGVPAPGQVAATVNGVTGFIPQNQVKAFQAKYPNATIGGQ
jgi:hypothetical protein